MHFNNFFTSGLVLDELKEPDLKNRYQMINTALVLSTFAFLYGVIVNAIYNKIDFLEIESVLILINIALFLTLRVSTKYFEFVATLITAHCTFLLLYIIYNSSPDSMKHVWLFTYPIVLMYFQSNNRGKYWLTFMLLMLLIAPLQNFVPIDYSLFQIIYISVVLVIVSLIVIFYQSKMREVRNIILKQQKQLVDFNTKLEEEVKNKTAELTKLNHNLEERVQLKIDKLIEKDKLLTVQSKQAVMGEMISMIAHQWRQPLSTITLQISNLEIKQLLGKPQKRETILHTLSEISKTVIYLSQTIDDFQTYFHPKKELQEIEIHTLLQKSINFILPRLKNIKVAVTMNKRDDINITTYSNQLIQVVLNILNNAVDIFISDKIANAQLTLDVKEEENFLVIKIKDNASGIKPENIEKIFEPYFSTKGKNGTGLGLYMSQMIVQKQFNGNISVTSSESGTQFNVKIQKKV